MISDLLLFVFQFHIPFAQLWIWEYAVFTLLCRLNCPLNLPSEQRKVFLGHLEKNFGLLVESMFMADPIYLTDTPTPDLTKYHLA